VKNFHMKSQRFVFC